MWIYPVLLVKFRRFTHDLVILVTSCFTYAPKKTGGLAAAGRSVCFYVPAGAFIAAVIYCSPEQAS